MKNLNDVYNDICAGALIINAPLSSDEFDTVRNTPINEAIIKNFNCLKAIYNVTLGIMVDYDKLTDDIVNRLIPSNLITEDNLLLVSSSTSTLSTVIGTLGTLFPTFANNCIVVTNSNDVPRRLVEVSPCLEDAVVDNYAFISTSTPRAYIRNEALRHVLLDVMADIGEVKNILFAFLANKFYDFDDYISRDCIKIIEDAFDEIKKYYDQFISFSI